MARCYLDDGRELRWSPDLAAGARVAVDAERLRPVPPVLAGHYRAADPEEFWARWTAVEVGCKLRDIPVAVWLRRRGLAPDPHLAVRTFRWADLVVSCGVSELRSGGPTGGPTPSPC